MNKEIILSDLKEAEKELEQVIREIESDANFDFDGYCVEMRHIYYHINKAWNLRNEDEEKLRNCSKKDFIEWSKIPKVFKL